MITMKKNKTINHIGQLVLMVVVVFLVFIRIFAKQHDGLEWWLAKPKNNSMIMIFTAITYACFLLWLDDFFKKNWKERNYLPLLAVVAGIVFILFLF